MSAVTIIIDLVLIIVSIVLIITVLMQQGQREGLGAIGGGAETFFGKNKAKSYEGKLATLTKICAALFIVLAIVATITTGMNKKTTAVDEINADELSELITDATEEAAEGTEEAVEEAAETAGEAVDEAVETVEEAAEEAAEGEEPAANE